MYFVASPNQAPAVGLCGATSQSGLHVPNTDWAAKRCSELYQECRTIVPAVRSIHRYLGRHCLEELRSRLSSMLR
jgi:hypothetical protein